MEIAEAAKELEAMFWVTVHTRPLEVTCGLATPLIMQYSAARFYSGNQSYWWTYRGARNYIITTICRYVRLTWR